MSDAIESKQTSSNQPDSASLPTAEEQKLLNQLKRFGPWRMSIQITENVNTGQLVESKGKNPTDRTQNQNTARDRFLKLVDCLYPNGLAEKRFLDCGCNAGAYCFWARERQAEIGYGFDAREHWIKQGRVVKNKRTVGPTNRIQLETLNLYDLPTKDLHSFDLVQFKGLFYHLSDPISGLKIATDHCRDILIFSTAFLWDEVDGALVQEMSDPELLHGGIDRISWFPTGPNVCAELIRNLGFEQLKLTSIKQVKARPERGRIEIIAARERGRLSELLGDEI